MKRKWLLETIFLFVLCITNAAYATTININTENKEVKPGDIVTVKISVNDIDLEGGINVIQGKLKYDKDIFEKVESKDITSINEWSMAYNDENSDSEGKFVILKLASGVKENQDMIEINLKVKEDAVYGKTDIELEELCTTDNENIITMDDSKVDVKVKGKINIIEMFLKWIKNIG